MFAENNIQVGVQIFSAGCGVSNEMPEACPEPEEKDYWGNYGHGDYDYSHYMPHYYGHHNHDHEEHEEEPEPEHAPSFRRRY